jgi:hypothetical protein
MVMILFTQVASSQLIPQADWKKLRAKEDTLRIYARYLVTDSLTKTRMIADSFSRILVRALQIKNSFYYPFDAVPEYRRCMPLTAVSASSMDHTV